MAAPAQVRVEEVTRGSVRVDWKVIIFALSMIVQLLGGMYAYGRLAGQVDATRDDVQQIKIILMQRATRP